MFQSPHILPQTLPVRSVLSLVAVLCGEGVQVTPCVGGCLWCCEGAGGTSVRGADRWSLSHAVSATQRRGLGDTIATGGSVGEDKVRNM